MRMITVSMGSADPAEQAQIRAAQALFRRVAEYLAANEADARPNIAITALANLACAIALRFGPGETAALFRDLASLCERPPGGPPPPGRMQ